MANKQNKISKKVVIMLIALFVLVGVLVAFIILYDNKNGKYVEQSFSQNSMEFYIDVNGNAFNLTLKSSESNEQTVAGNITFDKDVVILETEEERLEGSYNKKDKTIHVAGYTFTKEE